ncbi:ubiquitin carboxyl-terminal hydrolase family protein, putative [Ichthyophthirius multifiliis]|uniref:Ubiquitin carboxyl-terminal hydrolase family protein, putative n=1 Tax=Ichthyophthirius multifiliis TaxID=5932 RepID=G0QYH4_ICHMU|nr:ubiquitin carboxyl-terminal hydrolase family protein, putative [Ichthyophthirius multifiliis]EGR29726.1 ubiquitin carboxyl-terminal hydrolase family protein, putative [Ichthyophthirius multifiliis]|eukprot:XP_004030962.1 ubiquitin carboxyl-terminal hydrolase family protein, putative [Ichthyophthirius multifiliis]
MLSYIFNKNQFYFKTNQLNPQIFYIQQLFPVSNSFHQFQASLKIGDFVDAIKTENIYYKNSWSRAKIIKCNEEYIQLQFLNTSIDYNKQVWRYGFEIRPFKSMCPDDDWDWRFQINKGDLVDCCDNSHVWYKCTVFDLKNDGDELFIFIGYRYYDENGVKTDQKGRFFGWQAQYDEWMDVTNPRLQKLGTQAKKVYTKASTNNNQEEMIDDFSDRVQICENLEEEIFAVPRRNYCTSFFLISAVNKFGKKGGFKLIKEKIANFNENEWCQIDFLASYMNMFDQIQGIFHCNFAKKYSNELIYAVQKNVLESPASNLRNFTKEKIDLVNRGLDGQG